MQDTAADTLSQPGQVYRYIRGLEQEEQKRYRTVTALWSGVTYMPKKVIYAVKFASGYGMRLMYEQKFVDRIEEYFFDKNKTFGWYPILILTSQYRPKFGLNLFYVQGDFETVLRGDFAAPKKNSAQIIASYRIKTARTVWRFTLSGLEEYNDDRVYYGLGPDPLRDSRNSFSETAADDHGTYIQHRQKVQFITGLRTSNDWQFFWTCFFQRRKIYDAVDSDNPLGSVFDLAALPKSVKQFYNELSVRYDSRDNEAYLSPGIFCEGHTGISLGVLHDRSRFLRYGLDFFLNIPVIHQNRFLRPRMVIDVMKNIDDDRVPFVEYPRQPTFRGVALRRMYRTDEISTVVSFEYQWPLSFNLGGHLFFDNLIVAKDLSEFGRHTVPWAIGFGIDFHALDDELARFITAYGPEGIRFAFHLGIDELTALRSDWE